MGIMTLVRHGQASFGASNYDELSPLGKQQSEWLGEYFDRSNITFDAVVCGSMVRHQQTVDGILSSCSFSADVCIDERVNEFDFVDVISAFVALNPQLKPDKDTSRRDYYRLLKLAVQAWQSGETDKYIKGESWSEFTARTHGFAAEYSKTDFKHVLVVASGGSIGAMLQFGLGAPAKTAIELNLQIYNASSSRCFVGRGSMQLAQFNDVAYLNTEERRHALTYS